MFPRFVCSLSIQIWLSNPHTRHAHWQGEPKNERKKILHWIQLKSQLHIMCIRLDLKTQLLKNFIFCILAKHSHTSLLFTHFPCKFWVNMLSKSFYQLRSQLCSQQNLYCLYMCCTFFLMLTPKIKTSPAYTAFLRLR